PGAYDVVTYTLPSGAIVSTQLPYTVLPPRPALPLLGPYNITYTVTVPTWFRSGTVLGIHRVSYNSDGTRISCMDLAIPAKEQTTFTRSLEGRLAVSRARDVRQPRGQPRARHRVVRDRREVCASPRFLHGAAMSR